MFPACFEENATSISVKIRAGWQEHCAFPHCCRGAKHPAVLHLYTPTPYIPAGLQRCAACCAPCVLKSLRVTSGKQDIISSAKNKAGRQQCNTLIPSLSPHIQQHSPSFPYTSGSLGLVCLQIQSTDTFGCFPSIPYAIYPN